MRRSRTIATALVGGWALVALAMGGAEVARADDAAAATGPGSVVLIPVTGVIDDLVAEHVAGTLAQAARDGETVAVIVELDTPGGSLSATNRITGALLESPLPVIVWVAPAGGRAASAGTFITLAGALALMAEGTNIGAASPVGAGGEEIGGTLGEKVRNDAIAKIRSIAEARGRNVEWAASTVERAVSVSAETAVRVGAVDGIANTLPEVLAAASGREIATSAGPVSVELEGLEVRTVGLGPVQVLLHTLSDPNVAFVLFVIGLFGLLFELLNPNLISGIAGAFGIILAFIGFGSLPLSVSALLLVALGVGLLAAETAIVSHGVLGISGIVALVLGGSLLYGSPASPTGPVVAVAGPLLATMAILGGLAAIGIGLAGVRTRRIRGASGTVGEELPAGTAGEVRVPLAPTGSVYAAGEEWTARAADGTNLPRGTAVRVLRRDGLTVIVEPLPGSIERTPTGP